MSVLAADPTRYALRVDPHGTFRLLNWNADNSPRHALSCDTARPVDLTTQLLMWVDEDALALGHEANTPAANLIALYLPRPLPYFGPVVFTGSTTPGGELLGLTQDQAVALVGHYLDHAPTGMIPRPRR
ncbi:DUF3846 domain-containing protein [Streptomyces sp. NPDC050485]|uniref:DUF3846 domain-containing protein n=1 Tax=Streptomyces sp. NPDC050485 TaxID=3365617 RepID=UPI0037906447